MNSNVINEEVSLIRQFNTKVRQYKDGISFAIGEPEYVVNNSIITKTKEALDNKDYKYTNAQGDLELLDAIAKKEKVDTSNVLITSGASEGIFISLVSLLQKEDEVIIITPCYPQYAPVVKFLGGIVKYLNTEDTNFMPTYSGLISLITNKTKAIIINTPANPTGIIYDSATMKMINEISINHNIYLLCDDVYESLCFIERKPHPFKLKNTIFFKSFSKSYAMTGFRLGYIITNEYMIQQLLKVHSYLSISIPPFIQKAGIQALSTGTIKKDFIIRNLDYITTILIEENISFIDVEGGIFIFINIEEFQLDSISFCTKFLEEYHVACVPGICFNHDNFIRINFAISNDKLVDGLNKFILFTNNIRNKNAFITK